MVRRDHDLLLEFVGVEKHDGKQLKRTKVKKTCWCYTIIHGFGVVVYVTCDKLLSVVNVSLLGVFMFEFLLHSVKYHGV